MATFRFAPRIALIGANGLGKSTFLRHILSSLDIPKDHLIYLPQEIDGGRAV